MRSDLVGDLSGQFRRLLVRLIDLSPREVHLHLLNVPVRNIPFSDEDFSVRRRGEYELLLVVRNQELCGSVTPAR